MPESFERRPVLEEDVINILNTKELDDPEVRGILDRYIDQCHADADAEAAADPQSCVASNRANINAEIRLAKLYMRTDWYIDLAVVSLEDALLAAQQNEDTKDLVNIIEGLLSEINDRSEY